MGLRRYYFNHAELRTTHEFDEQLLHLAQQTQDPALLLEAHRVQGSTLFSLGDLHASLDHLEQGYQLYNRDQHRTHTLLHGIDPGTMCLSWGSLALWTLGYPDKARQRSQAALTLSHDLSHAYSRAAAHVFAARFHHLCREMQMVREHAELAVSLSTEQGFPLWLNLGEVMQDWAQAVQEHREEGIAHLSQILADAQTILGGELSKPYYLLLLAEVHRTSGQSSIGLNALTDALTTMDKYEERWCEAEIHRLKGELLLQQSPDNSAEAETCFHQAIAIAQNQSAKSWELRAATSLAKLWQQQGKRDEARELLGDVYGWFTEGFDTVDLIDAKALLDELTEGSS